MYFESCRSVLESVELGDWIFGSEQVVDRTRSVLENNGTKSEKTL